MDYNSCAQFYQSYAEPVFDSLADQLIAQIERDQIDSALDICTGTGIILKKLATRFPSASLIMGVDISSRMLDMAKTKNYGNRHVCWSRMNAEELGLASESFSLITNHLALHHLNPIKALKEMFRVLTAKGILAIHVADASKESMAAPYGLLTKIFYHAFKLNLTKSPSEALEQIRQQFNKEYSSIDRKNESGDIVRLLQPETLKILAQEIGFTNVESKPLVANFQFPDSETFLQFTISNFPYYQQEMEEMTAQGQARMRRDFEANAKKYCLNAEKNCFEEKHLIIQLVAQK